VQTYTVRATIRPGDGLPEDRVEATVIEALHAYGIDAHAVTAEPADDAESSVYTATPTPLGGPQHEPDPTDQ
jgi:hypothetical protein